MEPSFLLRMVRVPAVEGPTRAVGNRTRTRVCSAQHERRGSHHLSPLAQEGWTEVHDQVGQQGCEPPLPSARTRASPGQRELPEIPL